MNNLTEKSLLCPTCKGKNKKRPNCNGVALSQVGYWLSRSCHSCKGSGMVTKETVQNIKIGASLRAAREKKNLTYAKIASAINIPRSIISLIESGQVHHSEAPGLKDFLLDNQINTTANNLI